MSGNPLKTILSVAQKLEWQQKKEQCVGVRNSTKVEWVFVHTDDLRKNKTVCIYFYEWLIFILALL